MSNSVIRRSLLVATAIAACAVTIPASPASANPCCVITDVKITYYSDAAFTSVVGVSYVDENCGTDSGIQTPYYTTSTVRCIGE